MAEALKAVSALGNGVSPVAAAALGEATQTSRAALRPWTAAIVKISAGRDADDVRPLGLVVTAGFIQYMLTIPQR